MSSESVVFTVRMPREVLERIEQLATAVDRPRTWVVNRAIEDYLAVESWQIEEIHRGLAEADRGDFADPAEVDAIFAKYAETEAG